MTTRGYPAGNVFYRSLTRSYPRIVRGEGCYLVDDGGRRYLDACGGAFVANIGHGVPEIAEAVAEQLKAVAYVSGMVFTSAPVEALAEEIAARCPRGLDQVYFLSSGSEAVEAALKLARQYWVERGHPGKHKIIAASPGYHGSTILALSASARERYKTYFRDWLVDVVRVPAPYAYRCACGGADERCPVCSGAVLEEVIRRESADTVAAFIIEPIGGASTGATVPRPEYFRRVRDICDRSDVLLVADEVLTGAGRTGTWTAMEHYGVVPDIMTMGKGIAGGYAPLSAVVASRRIVDVLAAGSGALLHAQTFSHHAGSCAAGLAVVRYCQRHRLVERAATMGWKLHERLHALRAWPHVGDVRGRGLLAGVELVEDVVTRAPFPRALRVAETFADAARARGLVVWPNAGHLEGGAGDLIMLAPPFVITEPQIEELISLFAGALEATVDALRGAAKPAH